MKKFYTLLLLSSFLLGNAQTKVSIPKIQGSGYASSMIGRNIVTEGVVTAVFIGSDRINGFFIQDLEGDGNIETSDGIFVYYSNNGVRKGDKVKVTAVVDEFYGRTQLKSVSKVEILSQNNELTPLTIDYDAQNWDWEKYEGMLVQFSQTLFVSNNEKFQKYGELELRTKRKSIPTNVALPNSSYYNSVVAENSLASILLDDAYSGSFHKPILFADENGTRRTGERVDNLTAVVDYSYKKYRLYPISENVVFYGNPRQLTHDDIGNYNLKVCAFNLEYYLTQGYGSGFGAYNESEAKKQHLKIMEALKGIDADIYGLIEIERGQAALTKLTNALNTEAGVDKYDFINDGGNIHGTYTKVGYIYNKQKVSPYKNIKDNSSPTRNYRKKLQAFTLKENNERFLFSLNHFKSKNCGYASGNDKDQSDGQSCYNQRRVREAESTVSFVNNHKYYYDDDDVLIMGDLNAYAKEDPIQVFVNADYTDLLQKFEPDTAYSYVYGDEVGYLDHALANKSLSKQVTGVAIFHINSDEQEAFGYSGSSYQPTMYRCSDHDPVIVGLDLGNTASISVPKTDEIRIYPTIVDNYISIFNAKNSIVQIYSLDGLLHYQTNVDGDKKNIYIQKQDLVQGAYIVRVFGEKGVKIEKIIIK